MDLVGGNVRVYRSSEPVDVAVTKNAGSCGEKCRSRIAEGVGWVDVIVLFGAC